MTLADRIVVMNFGLIEQVCTPDEMYNAPKTRFVASFIGSPSMNFLPCRVVSNGNGSLALRLTDKLSLAVPPERAARYRSHLDRELVFGIRPEHISDRPPRSEEHTPELQS